MDAETDLMVVRDGERTLYYERLAETRPDGVSATLVGYGREGREYWY